MLDEESLGAVWDSWCRIPDDITKSASERSSKLRCVHPAKLGKRGGRNADYRRGLTYATTDGCDVERRDGRGCLEDFAARIGDSVWDLPAVSESEDLIKNENKPYF